MVVMAVALSAGCQQPEDGPGAVGRAYLEALAARDAKSLYSLMAPDVRKRVEVLYNQLKRTRELIEGNYPADKRPDALKATRTNLLDKAASPQALFEQFVAAAGETANLNRLQQLGMRIKDVEHSGDNATVTTLGGDVITLIREDAKWLVTLSLEDNSRLQSLEKDAEKNLGRVRQQVASIQKKRFGGAPK